MILPQFPQLECGPCRLRPWRDDDLSALVRHANNAKIAANLRDRFPHPYTEADAQAWLEQAATDEEGIHLAIDVDGEAVGAIGLLLQSDVNAGTAEIGYWLGERYWGRGIATAAVRSLTQHALTKLQFRRLFATALAENRTSHRVLEKAGYRLEGILRRSAIKNSQIHDQALYAIVAEDF